MSKIYIEEVDLTTVEGPESEGTDIVYIPGFSSLSNVVGGAKVGVPTLCRTVAEFVNNFGSAPVVFATAQAFPTGFDSDAIPAVAGVASPMFAAGDPDPSYIYAKELLALGIPVVYERINTYASEADAGSTELYDVTVDNMYSFLSSNFTSTSSVTTTSSLTAAVVNVDDKNLFINTYPDAGNYTFTAQATVTAATNITGGSVNTVADTFVNAYSGRYREASSYIFTANLSNISTQGTTSISGATVAVTTETFRAAYPQAGTYVFTYSSNAWKDEENETVTLADIGISLSGASTIPSSATITVVVSYTITWKDSNTNEVTLKELGITLTGIPVANSTITVTVASIVATNQVWLDVSGQLKTLADIGLSLSYSGTVLAGDTIDVSLNYVDPILLDKSLYSIKYITSGGYPTFEYNGKVVSQAMANLAKNRGDAIALIDHTNNSSRDLLGVNSVFYKANSTTYILSSATQSYAAMFTPYCTYSLNNEYSSVSTGLYDLPPSFAYLSCLANSISSNPSWLAIAGAARGKVVGLNSVDTDALITNSIADSYQSDTAVCVNPITNIRPYGQCIWGNRTLLDNSVKQGTTALSFLNIRNLVCDIKKQVFMACQSLLFEQNTDVLWINFLSMTTPLLDKMVSGYGINNYKIIRIDPSNKSRITAEIRIYPVYAVEAFSITLYLQNGEVQVEE